MVMKAKRSLDFELEPKAGSRWDVGAGRNSGWLVGLDLAPSKWKAATQTVLLGSEGGGKTGRNDSFGVKPCGERVGEQRAAKQPMTNLARNGRQQRRR